MEHQPSLDVIDRASSTQPAVAQPQPPTAAVSLASSSHAASPAVDIHHAPRLDQTAAPPLSDPHRHAPSAPFAPRAPSLPASIPPNLAVILYDMLSQFPYGVWVRSVTDHKIVYANPTLVRMTSGMAQTGVPLEKLLLLVHPEDIAHVVQDLSDNPRGGYNRDCRLRSIDGSYRWVHVTSFGVPTPQGDCVVGVLQDIHDRKLAENNLFTNTTLDPLTGIANRQGFMAGVKDLMAKADTYPCAVVMAVMDLDGFKPLNDTLGRACGDMLLRQLGQRLQVLFKGQHNAIVARLGGDEFGVAMLAPLPPTLPSTDTSPANAWIPLGQAPVHPLAQDPATTALRLLGHIKAPFFVEGKPLQVGASLGLASYPLHAQNEDDLIRCADMAMTTARKNGRSSSRWYHPDLELAHAAKKELDIALHRAVHSKQFDLFYQPKVDAKTGHWTGVEALLRWKRPNMGHVMPSDFINALETNGLILPLGNWVIQEACRQMQQWQENGVPPIRVAVNVSSQQLNPSTQGWSLEEAIMQAKRDHPLAQLDLELTESTLMTHSEDTLGVFERLRHLGAQWSIDDFGTGYSSLSYIKKFPIHAIKIDRSFITDLHHNQEDHAIVSAIISMAKSLKLEVVAEGVETQDQYTILEGLGCDQIQGFLIGQPMSGERMQEWLLSTPKHQPLVRG